MSLKKRGISPIIATVLLLVITVVTAGIIATFVVPFVKDSLSGGQECFDALGKLEFAQTGYNCFNVTIVGQRTGFSVRVEGKDIAGFSVTLQKGGSSDSFDVKNGSSLTNIRMLNNDFNTPLIVPQGGGVRTYIAKSNYERMELYPIVGQDKRCDVADRITIVRCTDVNVADDLREY